MKPHNCTCPRDGSPHTCALVRRIDHVATPFVGDDGARVIVRLVPGRFGRGQRAVVRCGCGRIDEVIARDLSRGRSKRCRVCAARMWQQAEAVQ